MPDYSAILEGRQGAHGRRVPLGHILCRLDEVYVMTATSRRADTRPYEILIVKHTLLEGSELHAQSKGSYMIGDKLVWSVSSKSPGYADTVLQFCQAVSREQTGTFLPTQDELEAILEDGEAKGCVIRYMAYPIEVDRRPFVKVVWYPVAEWEGLP